MKIAKRTNSAFEFPAPKKPVLIPPDITQLEPANLVMLMQEITAYYCHANEQRARWVNAALHASAARDTLMAETIQRRPNLVHLQRNQRDVIFQADATYQQLTARYVEAEQQREHWSTVAVNMDRLFFVVNKELNRKTSSGFNRDDFYASRHERRNFV